MPRKLHILSWMDTVYKRNILQSRNNNGNNPQIISASHLYKLLCTVLYSRGIWTPLHSHGACQNAAENLELRICWHGLHQTFQSIWPKTRHGNMEGSCSNSWQVVYINQSQHGWTGFLHGCSISWGPRLFREVTYVKYLILHLNLLWMAHACANYRGRITSAIL